MPAQTKTKSRTRVKSISKTAVALTAAGLIVSAAAAGFAAVGQLKHDVQSQSGRPYQTQGYTPGYVPGYIPGQIPGYGLPGYVQGYGFFRPLTGDQFRDELRNWVKNNFFPF